MPQGHPPLYPQPPTRLTSPVRLATLALGTLAFGLSLSATDIVLTDPTYGKINAGGLDQPVLDFVLTDPANGDAPRSWLNPDSGLVEPVIMKAFVDTGASGFALSFLHATGLYDVPNLALTEADYAGDYTETGVGGAELGRVSRPFGVHVRNGEPGTSTPADLPDFVDYGSFALWVRTAEGLGETLDFGGLFLADPINLVGMPVIRQRRLWLDPRPMVDLERLRSTLLAPADAEPPTEFSIPLHLVDFFPPAPPPGETFPSYTDNPVVTVTATHTAGSTTGDWLLDTGAASTILSFATATATGLIPAEYATLDDFLAAWTGPVAQIGGIGDPLTVPILTIDRLSVQTTEGATLVWENVDVYVADVAGLPGIFGMNLLVPAVTIDSSNPGDLEALFDISPGAFTGIVIDTTSPASAALRLQTGTSGNYWSWAASRFSIAARRYGDAAPDANTDLDPFPNALEYALDLDPVSPNPALTLILLPGNRPALSFRRLKAAADAAVEMEATTNFTSWHSGPGWTAVDSTVDDGDYEIITVRVDLPAPLPATIGVRLTGRILAP